MRIPSFSVLFNSLLFLFIIWGGVALGILGTLVYVGYPFIHKYW